MEPFEKTSNAVEEFDKCVITSADAGSSLVCLDVTRIRMGKRQGRYVQQGEYRHQQISILSVGMAPGTGNI